MTKSEKIKLLEAELKAQGFELEKYRRNEESFAVVSHTGSGCDVEGRFFEHLTIHIAPAPYGSANYAPPGVLHSHPNKAHEIKRTIKSALTEPPRNCDVGTAEEQHERFMKFCVHVHKSVCGDCPLIGGRSLCQLQWAQMPYEESEATHGRPETISGNSAGK